MIGDEITLNCVEKGTGKTFDLRCILRAIIRKDSIATDIAVEILGGARDGEWVSLPIKNCGNPEALGL